MWLYLIIFLLGLTLNALSMHDNFALYQSANSTEHAIVYLFAHGFSATQHQGIKLFARTYSPDSAHHWLMDEPIAAFDFPDAKNDHTDYVRQEVNLGQEKDIERLRYAYKKTRELLPNHDIILVGISRGATTIINFVALDQPEKIKALVLESPFDELSAVIKHLLAQYHVSWVPFSDALAHKLCQKYFPAVNPNGLFPFATIDKIPSTMPILFIHSKKDAVVPINSSRRLYSKLRQMGNEHAYLVELASGDHGKLIQGPDSDFYLYTVHAFYKKYGCTYDADLAQKGTYLLAHCQPSQQEVATHLMGKRNFADQNLIWGRSW